MDEYISFESITAKGNKYSEINKTICDYIRKYKEIAIKENEDMLKQNYYILDIFLFEKAVKDIFYTSPSCSRYYKTYDKDEVINFKINNNFDCTLTVLELFKNDINLNVEKIDSNFIDFTEEINIYINNIIKQNIRNIAYNMFDKELININFLFNFSKENIEELIKYTNKKNYKNIANLFFYYKKCYKENYKIFVENPYIFLTVTEKAIYTIRSIIPLLKENNLLEEVFVNNIEHVSEIIIKELIQDESLKRKLLFLLKL